MVRPAGAMRRFIEREGRDATLYESSLSGEDSWKDATADDTTTTATKALVRYRGRESVTITVAGEKVEVEAEVVVPDTLAVDPEANDRRPEIEVGGTRFKIWKVDPNSQPGSKRLLTTST